MVEVGDKRSGSNGHRRGGRRTVALEWTQQKWEASVRAHFETVEVGDERPSFNEHGRDGKQAFRLELRWRWETSDYARIDTAEAESEHPGSI